MNHVTELYLKRKGITDKEIEARQAQDEKNLSVSIQKQIILKRDPKVYGGSRNGKQQAKRPKRGSKKTA